jgi:hypothetical protein
VAVQHVRSAPRPLAELRPDLPEELCRIVHRMLAKLPDERYVTPRELLVDLRGLLPPGENDGEVDLGLGAGYTEVHAATERLALLTRTAALRTVRVRRRRWWLAAAALAAAAIGGVAGWLTRPPFLLAGAGRQEITRQTDAQAQLYFAKLAGTEAWLKSVEQYFPDAEYEVRMARQELARRYLYQGRWSDAGNLFDEFAQSADPAARAFGLAGQSIVQAKNGNFDESARRLAEFWPLHDKLDDPHLARLLRTTLEADRRASRTHLGQQEADALKQWLDEDARFDAL